MNTKLTEEEIKEHFKTHVSDCAYVRMISEADFGCEERANDSPLKCYVAVIKKDGESSFETEDSKLTSLGIAEGMWLTEQMFEKLAGKADIAEDPA